METTRERKIERIYEVMSDKTLSPGCKVYATESFGPVYGTVLDSRRKVYWEDHRITTEHNNSDIVILGHPVMIGDVLDWYNKVFGVDLFFDTIPDEIIILFGDRKEKRKPIEEQSDECIDYLYSLLPTEDDLKRK